MRDVAKSGWHSVIDWREAARFPAGRLTLVAQRGGDRRTERQILEHYRIERELADRLRNAPRAERRALYSVVYDELLRRVPHHPMLRARRDQKERARRRRNIRQQLAFLRRFLTLRTVFMEIGAGDCRLAVRTTGFVKQVYAIDVSARCALGLARPIGLTVILSDGCSIPVPEGSVDVAFSDRLMEHLHPEDAKDQLQNIHRSLAHGGIYVCITPNRLYGPSDISQYFDETATGLHLREYTARELRELLTGAGFSRVRFYVGAGSRFLRCPYLLIAAAESVLGALPYRLRKPLADTAPIRALLGLRVAAMKRGTA